MTISQRAYEHQVEGTQGYSQCVEVQVVNVSPVLSKWLGDTLDWCFNIRQRDVGFEDEDVSSQTSTKGKASEGKESWTYEAYAPRDDRSWVNAAWAGNVGHAVSTAQLLEQKVWAEEQQQSRIEILERRVDKLSGEVASAMEYAHDAFVQVADHNAPDKKETANV